MSAQLLMLGRELVGIQLLGKERVNIHMRLHELLKEETIQVGDHFDLELDDLVIETVVVDLTEDGVVIAIDDIAMTYINLTEAKYQGREVPLGKPMKGDVKKSKVYVRGPKGNVVKVNFGDKKMRIKKSNPKRRKSFRARHNCKNPGPRWKARYWSCRSW
jgi:hypothetical protein